MKNVVETISWMRVACLLPTLLVAACGGGSALLTPDSGGRTAQGVSVTPATSAAVSTLADGDAKALADIKLVNTDSTADAVSAWPFSQPPVSELRRSPKKVFAHYMTTFPISLDNKDPEVDYYTANYLVASGEGGKFAASGGFIKERPLPRASVRLANWDAYDLSVEVKRAVALGLDGFALDILASSGVNWTRTLQMLDVANTSDPNFKILLMPDMEGEFKAQPQNVLPVIRALARHPAAYRLADGRLVISPYNAQNQSVAWWQQVLATLRAEGIQVAFFPVFQGAYRYAASYAGISYGVSDWGDRSPGANALSAGLAMQVQSQALKWMAPVSPQDMRAKDFLYWEARNSENYRVMWENAIAGGADWVQIITWNDYSEGSEIAPSTGIQWSFYDLTAYYVTWFKTGVRPTIVRDVLYYFHRPQPTTALPTVQTRLYAPGASSDPPANDIELLAFLVDTGQLQISTGVLQTSVRDAGPGMTSFKVPLTVGRPSFKLQRQNTPVITLTSGFPISNNVAYQDLLYRGGSSSRVLVAPR